jgi:hypothetical protein
MTIIKQLTACCIEVVLSGPPEARAQQLLWTLQTHGAIQSSPLIADGVLYVGSSDHHLWAIEIETGKSLWSTRRVERWIPHPLMPTEWFTR